MNVFDEMGKYWEEIADRDQTDRQVELIKGVLKPHGLVLDLACGTGRHLMPLAKAEYGMVGLDISLCLLKIAKSRWRGADLVRADMRFLPFKSGVFSGVVSLDTSFGYSPSEQDDLQSLKEVKSALEVNGVLVLDVFSRDRLWEKYKATSQATKREYPSFFLFQTRQVTPDGGELHDEWVVRDKSDGQTRVFHHVARLYKPDQLQGLLEEAGLEVSRVFGDYEGQQFDHESNRLIMVATRK